MWLPLVCFLLGTWPATPVCTLTGNRTSNPLVRRRSFSPPSPNFRLVEENICATSFLDLVSLGYLVYVLMVLLILFFTVFVWHLSFHLVICPENLVILASENIFSGLHRLKGILTRGLCSFNLCC